MMPVPGGVRVWLASVVTDMRRRHEHAGATGPGGSRARPDGCEGGSEALRDAATSGRPKAGRRTDVNVVRLRKHRPNRRHTSTDLLLWSSPGLVDTFERCVSTGRCHHRQTAGGGTRLSSRRGWWNWFGRGEARTGWRRSSSPSATAIRRWEKLADLDEEGFPRTG